MFRSLVESYAMGQIHILNFFKQTSFIHTLHTLDADLLFSKWCYEVHAKLGNRREIPAFNGRIRFLTLFAIFTMDCFSHIYAPVGSAYDTMR